MGEVSPIPLEEYEEIVEFEDGVRVVKQRWYLVKVGEEPTDEEREYEKHLTPTQEKVLKQHYTFRAALISRLNKTDVIPYLVNETFGLDDELKDNDKTIDNLKVYGTTNRKIGVRRLWETYLFSELSLPDPKTHYDSFIHSATKQLEGWTKEVKFERVKLNVSEPSESPIDTTNVNEPRGADSVLVYLSVEWKEDSA